MQLSRFPLWGIGCGLFFLACWVVLIGLASFGLPAAIAWTVLQLGPVCLVLGIAFIVFGMLYHLAVNVGYWRELRDDEHEGRVILSGRKRFERRKKKRRRREKNGKSEPIEVTSGLFDALD